MAAAHSEKLPLAFTETPEAEHQRLARWREEDPIALQDAINTSRAFVDCARDSDLEELQRIVSDAVEGELLQLFVLQAFVLVLKQASLDLAKAFINWGIPLHHEQLSQGVHLMCEVTTKENFSNAWRIIQLLTNGNSQGRIDINLPRGVDGWTPLCVACSDACLPLAFKLLELGADPNAITRSSDTPTSLARKAREEDNDEQKEAREIIVNMLRHHGGKERWQDALAAAKRPPAAKVVQKSMVFTTEDGTEMVKQVVSASQTRFAA